MTKSSTILVAYPTGGERAALDLIPHLEPMGRVLLRKYDKVGRLPSSDIEVALCVVTDDSSIDAAHLLQKDLGDIPTLVVDHTQGRAIPVNGFAGLTPPTHGEIARAVERLLLPTVQSPNLPVQPYAGSALTSRFDTTLSRLGDVPGSAPSMLAAAARQLAREIRATKAEAWFIREAQVQRVFALNSESDAHLPQNLLRDLEGRTYLSSLEDLDRKSERALVEYLTQRGLNVLAPMKRGTRLMGWVAFCLRDEKLTEDYLDDLHIATHLLSMTLPALSMEEEKGQPWNTVMSALRTGILLVGSDRTVTDYLGEIAATGSRLQKGDSVLRIRSSRVREMVIEALDGNCGTDSWQEPHSSRNISCTTHGLVNGTIAVHLRATPIEVAETAITVTMDSILNSLALPVVTEFDSGVSATLPSGSLYSEDAEAIRRCAIAALDGKAKSLRLRLASNRGQTRGVLFFETIDPENSHLPEDISKAVSFAVHL